jgi:hypothetical protein
MNFGEIRVFRFKRAQGAAEAIPTDLGIDTAAQFVVVDEKMPIIFNVFVAIAHVYRETCLSAVIGRPHLPAAAHLKKTSRRARSLRRYLRARSLRPPRTGVLGGGQGLAN